jgi:16S rRNA processing protein RimM
VVARVVTSHGVRGALRVELLTDFPANFRRLKRLLLGEELTPVDVLEARVTGDHAIVRIAGVETPEAAAALRGQYLYVPIAEAAKPPRGEFFWHQIVGLRVETEAGEHLGAVAEILRTGANDVYIVRGSRGEILIPAIEDVVREVDPATGRMVVRPLPGMLPGES